MAENYQCEYCNKTYSKNGNLRKHVPKCKVRNIELIILDEKAKHERQLQVAHELLEAMQRQNEALQKEILELKGSAAPK